MSRISPRVVPIALLLLVLLTSAACSRPAQPGSAEANADTGRTIQNKGSDTIVNLALAWAEAYREIQPDVSIAVTGGG